MFDWASDNPQMWWSAAIALGGFVFSLVAMRFVILRLPADYFVDPKRHKTPWGEQHPVVRVALLTIKNIAGLALLVLGIAMLVLPGPGMLALLLAIVLLDFPGKYAAERWFVTRRSVRRMLNRVRERNARPPLELPRDAGG